MRCVARTGDAQAVRAAKPPRCAATFVHPVRSGSVQAPVGSQRRRLLAAALGPVLAAGIASSADADRGRYVLHSVTERANPGPTVSKRLDQFRAAPHARVVVPAEWRRLSATLGQ